MVKAFLPVRKKMELVIDQIHRLPKPQFLPDTAPRDVILRIHFFHVKDQLMQKARPLGTLPDPYAPLQLFVALSQHTLQCHRQINTILKAPRNHNIQYQWATPAKMLITYNDTKHIVTLLQDGLRLLMGWGIIPDSPSSTPMEVSGREDHQTTPLPQSTNKLQPHH